MAHRIPTARDGVLRDLNTNGSLAIGMAEWYTWLEYHRSFCFETDCTAFTVRKEQRPGGWYWYAYRRKNGKLHSAYLGRSEELTLDRLNTIAAVLERVKTHEITDPKSTIHTSRIQK